MAGERGRRAGGSSGPARRSLGRPFLVGAAAGSVGTLPAVFLALAVPLVEAVAPLLLPGPFLLRPVLGRAAADWPGGVGLLLACVANGLVWGLVAVAGVAVVRTARDRPSRDGPAGDAPSGDPPSRDASP